MLDINTNLIEALHSKHYYSSIYSTVSNESKLVDKKVRQCRTNLEIYQR